MSGDSYVFVCADESAKEEGVELPLEAEGTLLLSVLQSQFNGASGLKYRNPVTGGWRAIKLVDGLLHPPDKEWGSTVYVVVIAANKTVQQTEANEGDVLGEDREVKDDLPCEAELGYSSDSYKRKLEDSEGQRASKNPRSQSPDNYPKPASPATGHAYRNQEDLIILGLEWTVTDDELRKYFEQFGELAHCEVKKDARTGKSRGFGFVRYGDRMVQANVFDASHTIKGRRVELKYPKQSMSYLPSKLFVGCLPLKPEVDSKELSEYFSQYGRLIDVYIPKPYRGFGFVTFTDPLVAQKVVNMQHTIRKSNINVSFADPKGGTSKSHFPAVNPFGLSLHYPPAHHIPRHQAPGSRYPYSTQSQQAFALGFGQNQQVAISRPAGIQDPHSSSSMTSLRTLPVSGATPPSGQGTIVTGYTTEQQQAYGQSTWSIR